MIKKITFVSATVLGMFLVFHATEAKSKVKRNADNLQFPGSKKGMTDDQKEFLLQKIKYTIKIDKFLDHLKSQSRRFKKGDDSGKPVSIHEYYRLNFELKNLLKYRWFEADTGFSKAWFKKLLKIGKTLAVLKKTVMDERVNGRGKGEKIKQTLKNFSSQLKKWNKLVARPQKISAKKQQLLVEKKEKWQKLMIAKYDLENRNDSKKSD